MSNDLRSFQVLSTVGPADQILSDPTQHREKPGQGSASLGSRKASAAGHPTSATDGPDKIGGLLRDARESRRLRIEEISAVLRIREDYLTAMEDDRFERLPGQPYDVGFIRAYAKYVGLDEENIVAKYRAGHPAHEVPIVPQAPIRKAGRPGHLVAVPLVLAVSILGIWMIVAIADSQRSTGATPDAVGALDETAEAASPPFGDAVAFVARLPEESGSNIISIREAYAEQSSPVGTTESSGEARVEIAALPASSALAERFATEPEGQMFGTDDGTARVVLWARETNWIEITNAKGGILFSSTLAAGDRYYVADNTDYVLLTGNAGGLDIYVDGEMMPSLGEVGRVRRNLHLAPTTLRDTLLQ